VLNKQVALLDRLREAQAQVKKGGEQFDEATTAIA